MYQPMGNVVIKYFTSCKILGGHINVGLFTVKNGNYFEDVFCSGFGMLHWKTVKRSFGSLATPPNRRLVPTSQVFPHHCRQPLPHAEMGDVSRSVKYRSSPPDPWQLNTSGGSYKKRPSPSKQNMREPISTLLTSGSVPSSLSASDLESSSCIARCAEDLIEV